MFQFVLDREPKESILRRLDMAVISCYFPEFERELPRYPSQFGRRSVMRTGIGAGRQRTYNSIVLRAKLAFSVWYSTQGLGRVQSMPAFDAKTFETAIKDAAG